MPQEHEEIIEETEIETVDPVVDEADASKEAEQSATAKSSDAADANETEGEDTLSLVRDVVGERKEETPAAASSASGEEQGQEADEGKTAKEPDNETYSDVPFHKHPRFQEVLGKLKTAETDATRYKNVEAYIEEQGLNGDEAAELLRIGGLIKTDPVAAWPLIQPIVQKVLLAAGEVLPEDLKTKVQAGEMSRDAALEVSRNRALVQSAEARREFETQRTTVRQQSDTRSAVLGAVNSWEADRRTRDPNFEAKKPDLEKEIVWLQTKEGRPNTPEGVKAQLQKAYDAVSAKFTSSAPAQKKPAIRPVTGGQVNGNTRPEINTSLDAVNAVLARRAG
ncbi:hypothetical protein [Nitratireductor soli]|uniref:hypothetical protein n=1 Tax=Nitratireductor soli TaxID=1670619 RepID=UPI00065E3A07|nr:hypothetical protein [Nitratireductor soli]